MDKDSAGRLWIERVSGAPSTRSYGDALVDGVDRSPCVSHAAASPVASPGAMMLASLRILPVELLLGQARLFEWFSFVFIETSKHSHRLKPAVKPGRDKCTCGAQGDVVDPIRSPH